MQDILWCSHRVPEWLGFILIWMLSWINVSCLATRNVCCLATRIRNEETKVETRVVMLSHTCWQSINYALLTWFLFSGWLWFVRVWELSLERRVSHRCEIDLSAALQLLMQPMHKMAGHFNSWSAAGRWQCPLYASAHQWCNGPSRRSPCSYEPRHWLECDGVRVSHRHRK